MTTYITPAYMRDFRCLGGDCEDTCCQHWDIWFDKKHYFLLEKNLKQDVQDLAQLQRVVEINQADDATDRDYAHLKLEPDGHCPFLQGDGYCHIHARYGESPLSNVCAFFPRVLSRRDDVIELSGALSCPELVRQCLFSARGNELVEFEPSLLPRPDDYPITRQLDSENEGDYHLHFDLVRQSLLDLAGMEGFRFESRMYFLTHFANAISVYYRDTSSGQDVRPLQDEVRRSRFVKQLQQLNEYVETYQSANPVALVVIQAILQLRVQQFPQEALSCLITDVLTDFAQTASKQGSGTEPLEAEALSSAFQQRRQVIDSCFGMELDILLGKYLSNCLYREWFVTMPDVFTYIHMLNIRLALLRFLLYSDRELLALAGMDDAKEREKKFEARVVYIVYNFARAVDHNMAFLKVIYQAMQEQQMMHVEYALPFIKL